MEFKNSKDNLSQDENAELKKLFATCLNNWIFFLLSVIVCVSMGYAYLRYATPMFNVNSTYFIQLILYPTNFIRSG